MQAIRKWRWAALLVGILCALVPFFGCTESGDVHEEALGVHAQGLAGDGLVISQVSPASGAYEQRFIELFNRSSAPISLDGLSVQWAGTAAGTIGILPARRIALPNVSVAAGAYYLIGVGPKLGAGMPVPADLDVGTASSLSETVEKIAIVRGVSAPGCGTAAARCSSAIVADLVGYKAEGAPSGPSDFEGVPTWAPSPAQTVSVSRKNAGCTDTDDNGSDFEMTAIGPRSAATAIHDCSLPADAGVADAGALPEAGAGDGLVISQAHGSARGTSIYKRNFVELYNRSSQPVSLDGLSLQYQAETRDFSATGSLRVAALPNVSVPAGGYYLIGCNDGLGTEDLIATDFDAPPTMPIGGTMGKLALARGTAPLPCGASGNRCSSERIIDMLGWGASTSDSEGSPAATTVRRNGGCRDTNNNAADFVDNRATPRPRNATSPVRSCPNDAGAGIVISQVYASGGEASSIHARDFVELFNTTSAPVQLLGLSVQTTSSAAFFNGRTVVLPEYDLPAGGYLLIGYQGEGEPAPDFADDVPVDLRLSGRDIVALARVTSELGSAGIATASDEIIDLVGFGRTTSEGHEAIALGPTTAAARREHGCTDTNDNAADFEITSPEPRSSLSFVDPCGGGGIVDGGVDAAGIDPNLGAGLVVSQLFGGGGVEGAAFGRDYVEIFNTTGKAISLDGLSLQYAEAGEDFGARPSKTIVILPNRVVAPERYFLVALGSDDPTRGAALEAEAVGPIKLDPVAGKLALARTRAPLGCGGATRCPSVLYVDVVGYGPATDYEGLAPAPALDATKAVFRGGRGCIDTNQNAADFTLGAPAPRNTTTPAVDCHLPKFEVDAGATDAGSAAPDASSPPDASPSVEPGDASSAESADGSGCACRASRRRGGDRGLLGGSVALGLLLLCARRRQRAS